MKKLHAICPDPALPPGPRIRSPSVGAKVLLSATTPQAKTSVGLESQVRPNHKFIHLNAGRVA